MRINKEIFIFPVLFLAAVWMTNAFWPHTRAEDLIREVNDIMDKKVIKSEIEWKQILTPEQFRVMRKSGTESPFSGKYNDHYLEGIYHCVACSSPLFSSDAKYDHGTGWPSYTHPVDEINITYHEDFSLFMKRIEVRCASCGSHLGHVFDDGPSPSSRHYCINSAALDFNPPSKEKDEKENQLSDKLQVATFAAGCFWGVEDKFRKISGVKETVVGYTGGTMANPSYQKVCRGNTGHAEAVQIVYDPTKVPYQDLLQSFFRFHDPTQINKQGPDVGSQYRSAIFYHNQEQKNEAEYMIRQLENSGRFPAPIATQISPASEFYPAEEYHQKFFEKLSKRKR